MKTTFFAAAIFLSTAITAAADEYVYLPKYQYGPSDYELNRNIESFRQYDRDYNTGKWQSDLRYQQQLEQIERNHQGIYGERINPVNPYKDF